MNNGNAGFESGGPTPSSGTNTGSGGSVAPTTVSPMEGVAAVEQGRHPTVQTPSSPQITGETPAQTVLQVAEEKGIEGGLHSLGNGEVRQQMGASDQNIEKEVVTDEATRSEDEEETLDPWKLAVEDRLQRMEERVSAVETRGPESYSQVEQAIDTLQPVLVVLKDHQQEMALLRMLLEEYEREKDENKKKEQWSGIVSMLLAILVAILSTVGKAASNKA